MFFLRLTSKRLERRRGSGGTTNRPRHPQTEKSEWEFVVLLRFLDKKRSTFNKDNYDTNFTFDSCKFL